MFAIGEAARQSGLKIPTIRFYEAEGLLDAPARSANGRRVFSGNDIKRLAFIRHVRTLGFELADVRLLLALTDSPDRPCAEVDIIARRQLEAVDLRIGQLRKLRKELARVVTSCAGGKVAQCRVVEALANHALCADDHKPSARADRRARQPRKRVKRRSRPH